MILNLPKTMEKRLNRLFERLQKNRQIIETDIPGEEIKLPATIEANQFFWATTEGKLYMNIHKVSVKYEQSWLEKLYYKLLSEEKEQKSEAKSKGE